MTLKYAQGDSKKLTFVANGSNLEFASNIKFYGTLEDENASTTAIVFGGSDNTACTDDAHIVINSGDFESVYGGSRGANGAHSGAVEIVIGSVQSADYAHMPTVTDTISGGSEYETDKVKDNDNAGNQKKSVISISYPLTVKNIYDYDQLNVNNSSSRSGEPVEVTENINSEKASGYAGETILGASANLVLSGNGKTSNHVRKMGSLKLSKTADANASLKFAKTTGTPSDKDNTNLVVLTKADPLASSHTKWKIEVGYSDDPQNPREKDIVFFLSGVPDDNPAAKEKQVSTEHLEDMFLYKDEHKDQDGNNIAMRANPQERTIVIVKASVGLSTLKADNITYSDPIPYITLEEALTALTENETKAEGSSYRINFFGDNYTFSAADKTAMEKIKSTTAKEILWTSKLDASGKDLQNAKTVSPAGDLTFFGQKSIVKDMTLNFTSQCSIYADGKPLEILSGVDVSVGTKPDLYGGSNTDNVDETNLLVLSGEFRNIYAGGDKKNVNRNTILNMRGGLATSVYGGGNGGTVSGDSTVSIELPNKAAEGVNPAKTDFTFTNISGQGTAKGGALTPSVTGTKTVSVVPGDKNTDLTVHVSNLTGFDQLTLGDATGKNDYANQQFCIKTRFDSRLTNGGTDRADTVNLKRSSLVLEGGSGHIGNLNTQKVSALVIKRENKVTSPLFIDGKVTVSSTETITPDGVTKSTVYDKIRLMYVDKQDSAENDVMVTYSSKVNTTATEAIFYEDGTSGALPTLKMDRENDTSDIIFSKKKAHTMEGEVIYPNDSRIEDASQQSENISKFIVVKYDPDNDHPVKGGYVVKIPKEKIRDKTYTENLLKQDGTYESPTLTEGKDIFKLNFDLTHDRNGAKGTTAVAVPIDTANFFYVAHVICTNADKSSLLLDVTAPKQSRTSGDAVIDYEGDGVNGTYHIHGDSRDYNITDKNLLPDAPSSFQSLGTKLTYKPHGVKLAAWSFGDVKGNEAAEKAIAKSDFGDDKTAVPKDLHLINITPAVDETVCDIKFDINQKDVEAAIEAKQEYLVVYVKDTVNNTAKYIIPLSKSMIDVKVPTKVSLVAIKKSGTGLGVNDCKLLAPTCYIVNYGSNQVKAEVAKFDADDTKLLKLVKDATNYNANQIALHLKDTESGLASNAASTDENTKFNLRNVLSIEDTKGKRAFLGNLAPKSEDGRTLDFTFGAYYDPANIQETEDWLTNTMSYHFSVVQTLPPVPPVPAP